MPRFLVFLPTAFALVGSTFSQDSQNLVKDGEFTRWKNKSPIEWKVEIGATTGVSGHESQVAKGQGPSLQFVGVKENQSWKYVSQRIAVKPETAYYFTFSGKVTEIKREAKQFQNCHANFAFFNQAEKKTAQNFLRISTDDYAKQSMSFRTTADTKFIELGFFLSMTGKLNIKNVSLIEVDSSNSFEVMVDDMDRNYSYFEHKKIDWDKLVHKYRDAATLAESPEQFKKTILKMLAEMNDMHVWINHGQQRFLKAKKNSQAAANFDFSIVDADLSNKKTIKNFALVGLTSDGFGYVRVTSLLNISDEAQKSLMNEIEDLYSAPGIIIDLRLNRGGAEPIAVKIASRFASKRTLYARSKFRSGPKHSDFWEAPPRQYFPLHGHMYRGPIVCLIGPNAVSSGEGFAMMMAAIERCKMLGQPTRGSSGNPQPVYLYDGIELFYSRWISMMPDGTPIEDRGVLPDEYIEHTAGSDRTFERAKAILKQ